MLRIFLSSLCILYAVHGETPLARAQTPSAEPPEIMPPSPDEEGDLSKRLDKEQGVLKPKPGVDPTIVKPAPDPGPHATPTIPPPSPGAK